MSKIELTVCMGTMCYVMGGAELKDALENLPEEVRESIDVSYSHCLGYCNEKEIPPFIKLNGRKIAGVSKNNLLRIIKEELNDVV